MTGRALERVTELMPSVAVAPVAEALACPNDVSASLTYVPMAWNILPEDRLLLLQDVQYLSADTTIPSA